MQNSDSDKSKIIWIAVAALFLMLISVFIFFPLLQSELHSVSPEAVKRQKIIDKALKYEGESIPMPENFEVRFKEKEYGAFRAVGGAKDSDVIRLAKKKTVKTLQMRMCELTDKGILALKREPLVKMELFRPLMTAEAVSAIGELKFLSDLGIRGTHEIPDELLSNLTGPPSVMTADFSESSIGPKTMAILPSAFPNLRGLTLRRCQNIDAAAISNLHKMKKLYYLNLNHAELDKSTIAEIARLKNLETLEISSAKITDSKAKPLSNSYIDTLNIARNPISDKSLIAISKIKKLKSLNANVCRNLTPEGIKKFKRKRPDVKCTFVMKVEEEKISPTEQGLLDVFFKHGKSNKRRR